MSLLSWVAVAVVILAIYALIKRYETRLVLIASGLFLSVIALQPMAALDAFAKSMTNASLVMAICSSMGFAFVSSYTKADRSLVHYMASPIRGLGIFLIPVCTAITFFVNIAIPSAAGCAAAVGSTLIPLMLPPFWPVRSVPTSRRVRRTTRTSRRWRTWKSWTSSPTTPRTRS